MSLCWVVNVLIWVDNWPMGFTGTVPIKTFLCWSYEQTIYIHFLTLLMRTPTTFYLKQTTFPAWRRQIFNKPSPKKPTGSIYGCVIVLSTFKAFWAFFQQAVSEFLIKLAKGGWGRLSRYIKSYLFWMKTKRRAFTTSGRMKLNLLLLQDSCRLSIWPPSWSQMRVREITFEESNTTRIQKSVSDDLRVKEPPEC